MGPGSPPSCTLAAGGWAGGVGVRVWVPVVPQDAVTRVGSGVSERWTTWQSVALV